jgi:hypothetical protein
MAVAVAEAVELLMEEAVAVAERLTAAAVVEHRAAVAVAAECLVVAAVAEHHACKRHPHLVCKHLRACRLPRACKHPLV